MIERLIIDIRHAYHQGGLLDVLDLPAPQHHLSLSEFVLRKQTGRKIKQYSCCRVITSDIIRGAVAIANRTAAAWRNRADQKVLSHHDQKHSNLATFRGGFSPGSLALP